MERQWTAAQQAAMDIRGKTLLVSAAAGSGKTATLTERIIRRITDPCEPADLSDMLIVTFTRAAAEELKNRIFAALSEALAKDPANRHLTAQLVKLGSAKICTIDSFYLELLRANFSTLGLSASFRIADPSEIEILSKSVMEESVEQLYETDDRFPSFAECLIGTRNADRLTDILFEAAEQLASVPEGIGFLQLSARRYREAAGDREDLLRTPFGQLIRAKTEETARHCLSVFADACCYCEGSEALSETLLPSFAYDKNFCETLLDAVADTEHGYRSAKKCLEGFEPVRLKRLKEEFVTEESDAYKALRTDLHKQLRELYKRFFALSEESVLRALAQTAEYTDLLYRVLSEYETRMREEKKRRNMLDFSDIRRYTLALLVDEQGKPTAVARQYAEEFSEIYIDEYQDVDRVQDTIFQAISRPENRFMVGDIKQSIYSFRGAEPQVFADYRSAFSPHDDTYGTSDTEGVTVFMSENFRCDRTVIDFTNLVCSRLFSACADSIGYCSADDLVFAKKPPSEDYQPPKVKVCTVYNKKEEATEDEDGTEEPPERKEAEAAYIASEIHRLITEEKKADGTPIRPGDIAVLFRSRSMSPYVADALAEYGILCSESDGARYFEDPDVLMVLSLLNAVDNPHRDIFLTGTLRSPLFGFDMNDLIRIRSSCDSSYSLYDALIVCKEGEDDLSERCRRFDSILTEWRRHAAYLPVDRFLRVLFESEPFLSSGLLCENDASGSGGNLLRLYEYARTFEASSFKGLYNFIEMINMLIEEGTQIKLPPKAASPDRVNLMTVHQSKGLEFPVCFLCGTAGRFNRRDGQASLLLAYPVGVAMKLSDSTGFARINTPMREALSAHLAAKQSEEEMRVLYVALTRARERLYVTASPGADEEKLKQKVLRHAAFCDRHTILRCGSYLDWLLLPFANPTQSPDCASLLAVYPEEDREAAENAVVRKEAVPMDTELYTSLREKLAFRYPHADLRRIPAKLSVSRLSPDVLDEEDTAPDLFAESGTAAIPDLFVSGEPRGASATERGTATHLFLQFCDFAALCRHGVEEELARLVEKRFLPDRIAKLVYTEELERLLDSELMERLGKAKRIIREQRFNLLLPASAFTAENSRREALRNETVAVQGVIDLVLLDEDGTPELYDYKTDRLTREELRDPTAAQKRMNERHGLQLSYYAHAAELLFGKPCRRICVYATHAGRLFDICPLPLTLPQNFLDTV